MDGFLKTVAEHKLIFFSEDNETNRLRNQCMESVSSPPKESVVAESVTPGSVFTKILAIMDDSVFSPSHRPPPPSVWEAARFKAASKRNQIAKLARHIECERLRFRRSPPWALEEAASPPRKASPPPPGGVWADAKRRKPWVRPLEASHPLPRGRWACGTPLAERLAESEAAAFEKLQGECLQLERADVWYSAFSACQVCSGRIFSASSDPVTLQFGVAAPLATMRRRRRGELTPLACRRVRVCCGL